MGNTYRCELRRILRNHGGRFVRNGKGDHEIWFSLIANLTFTVDASTRKWFTTDPVLKQAGIKAKL